jgi:hypothetical protein
MEILGKVKMISEVKQVSDSFKKQELVVTTDTQYPQHILIEFKQDKTDLLKGYKVGDNLKVSINISGREWVNPQGETKYFNGIEGWRVEKQESNEPTSQPKAGTQEGATVGKGTEEELEDLPF